MGFRITNSILYRTTLANVSRQRERLAVRQEQAASGLRVNRPSDDPAAVRTASVLKAALSANEQFGRNVTQSRSRVQGMESALANVNELLVTLRDRVLQGANDPTGDAAANLAQDVEQIHGSLLAEGNTTVGGSHVFSGYASQTPPFAVAGPFVDGSPSPVTSFAGDRNELVVQIDEGVSTRVTLNGQRVFMGDADGDGNVDAGRADVFDVAADVRDALLLPQDQRGDALRATLARIDTAIEQVGAERSRVGAIDTKLVRQQELLADRELRLTEGLSDAQDADAVEVFSDLVSQEAALQASLGATARVIQPTLMNFLGG